METLADLITRLLSDRKETLTAFAERIGSNRQTIRGWRTSLPSPAMLARVAKALDVPYSTVLAAGLRSAEYIDDLSGILAGHTVHAVARCDGSPYERGEFAPSAVFSDPARAREFVDVSNAVTDDTAFELAALVIDAAEPPPAVRIYTAEWSNRTDRITETSFLLGEAPTRLKDRTVSEINGIELADTGEIYRLRVDSIDPRAGREALQNTIDRLRSERRLLSPEVDTRDPRFSGPTEWFYEESLLAGGQDMGSTSPGLSGNQGPWGTAGDAMKAAGMPVPEGIPLPGYNNPAPVLAPSPAAAAAAAAKAAPRMPYVWGRNPVAPARTPIALTEAQPGDIGFIGGHTVTVVGPGEVVGVDGQRQPLPDIVDHPEFSGLFRITAADSPDPNTNAGRRRRRIVISSEGA